jgi:hypothetical protein
MHTQKKITTDDIVSWEIQSLGDALGNCLELNDDFLGRYCGEQVKQQLLRIPEDRREYFLSSHLEDGHEVCGYASMSDSEIMLPVGEIEYQFEGSPDDVFENPDEFTIHGDLAYCGCDGVAFPVDIAGLRQEIDEWLSSEVIDDISEEFIAGCLEGMIFTGQYYAEPENQECQPEPIDRHYGVDDIPREMVKVIEGECLDFLNTAAFMVAENPRQAGIDFHLTRNRHGAGFWDGGWEAYGAELTALSHPYGERELMAGPDGMWW